MTAAPYPGYQPPSGISDAQFERVRALIERELGLQVPDEKRPMIHARLARRSRELGFERTREYCDHALGAGASEEIPHLLDAVTTNFTYFYREPQQLDPFRHEMVPGLVRDADREGRPVRLWSAACSTGQEPWTLTMILADAGARAAEVYATDVSTRVLATARRAVYRADDLDGVPDEWRDRYFLYGREADDARVRIDPALRRWVTFQHLNLMADDYDAPSGLDAVLLRNVLIYFDRDTRRAVISRVARHVRPGGYLLVGTSESLSGLELPFSHVGRSIYRRNDS